MAAPMALNAALLAGLKERWAWSGPLIGNPVSWRSGTHPGLRWCTPTMDNWRISWRQDRLRCLVMSIEPRCHAGWLETGEPATASEIGVCYEFSHVEEG